MFPQPYFYMSLTAIVNEIAEKYYRNGAGLAVDKPLIYPGSGHVQETDTGRVVIVMLPKDTQSILVIPSIGNVEPPKHFEDLIEVIDNQGRPVVFRI